MIPSILVVDDSDIISGSVELMLRHASHDDIITVNNGFDAMKILNQKAFDVVMLDLNMPEMDGIQFIQRLAERSDDLAIIVMSGSDKTILDAAENIVEAIGMRLLGSLEKPFSQEMIISLLAQLSESPSKKVSSAKPLTLVSEEELQAIIDENRVVVHFQPKIDISQN